MSRLLLLGTGGKSGAGASTPLDGVSGVTAAWSASRDLLTSFIGGSKYTDAGGGAISQFSDQSGNSGHLSDGGTSARRPTLSTAGPNSTACLDFGGTDDWLSSAGAVSNFISASAGYMLVSFIIDAVTANSGNPYDNEPILGDTGGYMGIYVRDTASTPETAQAFNWSGGSTVATSAVIDVATAYVVEWWHDSGNLYLCVNNGSPVSVASGNTDNLTGVLGLGHAYTGSGEYLDGKIFEGFTASAVPGSRSTIAADFMNHIGAV